jgi:PAS domain S-box-containing protein
MTVPLLGYCALILSGLSLLAVVLRRRRLWAGCQRLFWDIFAAGIALWLMGRIGWTYETFLGVEGFWLSWHAAFTLCGVLGPLIALTVRPHDGVRRYTTATASVDVASYTLLGIFLYTYFFLLPGLGHSDGHDTQRFAVAQVYRTVLLLAFAVAALAAGKGPWRRVYLLLALGTCGGILVRAAIPAAPTVSPHSLNPFYDLASILSFTTYAVAALRTPPSPESDETLIESPSGLGVTLLSAVPVLLIPLVGFNALHTGSATEAAESFRTVLTGIATVFGIGLLTLRLVFQRTQLQRADARARLLAAATEQTADLILVVRADGTFEHANDAFLRAVGFSRREMALVRFPQPVEPEFAHLSRDILEHVRTAGVWRGTLRRRRQAGTSFPASSTVVGLKSPSGGITHLVAVERDITDELRLRDQLVHSERLSAVGELVAGVAHEINNPLQAIVGCVELMLDERADAGVTRRDLEIVRREAGRAGHIVRNLLSFVRRSPPNRAPADLNHIVRQSAELRDYQMRQRDIGLVLQLSTEPMLVLVNREEVQQVILNLLLNAEQALESTGRRGTITLRTVTAGNRHVVEVIDDGPGIPHELRGRIFEPFFTTKQVGEGTGLGLSISHGIAAAHGGALELCDRGPGACFYLALPVFAMRAVETDAGRRRAHGVAPRALIVDDEEPIRHLLSRLLKRRGYEVVEASNVPEAVEAARAFEPSVILCDVRMPGGGGAALYRQMRQDDEGSVRGFVFVTGDPTTGFDDADLASARILGKPFTAADLDTVLAEIVSVGP